MLRNCKQKSSRPTAFNDRPTAFNDRENPTAFNNLLRLRIR